MFAHRQIAKQQAGCLAAGLVRSGMRVGLGTGSTAVQAVHALGQRFASRDVAFEAVCTSKATERLARGYGIPLIDLDPLRPLDVYLDGADEIDPQGRLLKGGGGALLREKLVAAMARRRVILVDESKLSPFLALGHPLPVEVTVFGVRTTQWRLESLASSVQLRLGSDQAVFVSDEGHHILDCSFAGGLEDPATTERQIKATLGVVDCGLFLDYCDEVIVANSVRAELIAVADWPAQFASIQRSRGL